MATTEIESALAEIPDTDPQGVADWLLERGFQGYVDSPSCCPVANFLRDRTGYPEIYVEGDCGWCSDGDFLLPGSVANFIPLFDLKNYPELIAD